MRAHFIEALGIQDSYQLKGSESHHLLNVARVEKDEKILLLNGKGLKVTTKVASVSKRELILARISHEEVGPSYEMDLALGIPKKEALELSLKEAVELGFRRIYLVRAEYSQMRIPEEERLRSLLINALEQSNSPFLPLIINCSWKDIAYGDYEESLLMDSQAKGSSWNSGKSSGSRLLIIGPEGGFSPTESDFLHGQSGMKILRLPCPILRTPTAVATGAGLILGTLLD